MLNGQDRARDALQACDPSCVRDEWVRLAMAAKAAGLDFHAFDTWSAQADNYSKRDTRAVWNSIRRADGVGPGTLYKAAAQNGWNRAGKQARNRPANAPVRPIAPAEAALAAISAAETWARCRPATAEHGYIVAKQGMPDGLRVVPDSDPLTIAGQRMAGCLVVPVVPLAGGEPVSLQFIPPPGPGKKLNLPGAPIAGVFIVGDMAQGGTVFLCEGVGQAWACWKATGFPAVVCFGWGRVRGVAADLRQRDASALLVLVPDAGKEREAETIAREMGGLFVMMPADAPANFDANDYAAEHGHDALEDLLSKPQAPSQRYKLLGSADLQAVPPMTWRVRGVLPAQGMASVYGPSGSGKSFLALDMAAAMAEGRDWFGYRVKPAPVVYVALEGEAGFRMRVAAWEQANGRALPTGLRLVLQAFKLTEPQDVTDMAAAVLGAGDGAVTILDTLNRAAPEADENASADMGRILEAAKELQRLTGGLVLVVHHTGKDATKGLRGHSSLFAALDAAIEVTRDGDRKEWRVAKAKDGQDGAVHPFRLERIELAPDDEGEPVSSCVVRPDESAADIARVKLPQGGNQKLALEALRPLLTASPVFGKAGAPALRPCIELEAAVTAGAARLTCQTDRRVTRARDAITGLAARGVLGCCDGWVWLK
jgi:putative DNA primase/helicase